jgi:hypothetical protein
MEAFLTSGRPRFDTRVLTKWLNAAKEGVRGYIERKGFVEDDKGYITVYEQPRVGTRYVIGADTSQGLATGDRSAATVWDAKTWKLVAKWHGHIDPDLYADQLAALGYHYNTALLAVEINNHGFTTMNKLKNLHYPMLFQMERYDETVDKMSRALGFRTDRKTKPLIIDHLASCIREQLIEVHDKDFISECITYIREEDGGTNAQEGCFDDLVMASAIALFVLSNYLTDYFDSTDHTDASYASLNQDHLPHALRSEEPERSWTDY